LGARSFRFVSRRRKAQGGAALGLLVLLAVLAGAGYTAYSADRLDQDFQKGRNELQAAQAALNTRDASAAALQNAALDLKQAKLDFSNAQQRADNDPALRLFGVLPGTGEQVQAAEHLGAIGADLSEAGESAALIGLQLVDLKSQYPGPLTAADLAAVLQRAQSLLAKYQGSIQQIGRSLRAAHAERTQVSTTNLLPPLRHAYDQVDQALDEADSAFLRYQDPSQLIAGFLGVSASG
jgi:hypothetical protein